MFIFKVTRFLDHLLLKAHCSHVRKKEKFAMTGLVLLGK